MSAHTHWTKYTKARTWKKTIGRKIGNLPPPGFHGRGRASSLSLSQVLFSFLENLLCLCHYPCAPGPLLCLRTQDLGNQYPGSSVHTYNISGWLSLLCWGSWLCPKALVLRDLSMILVVSSELGMNKWTSTVCKRCESRSLHLTHVQLTGLGSGLFAWITVTQTLLSLGFLERWKWGQPSQHLSLDHEPNKRADKESWVEINRISSDGIWVPGTNCAQQ